MSAPPSLSPAVLSSLTSQPAAAEWLLNHAQHHILYHQQQLLYWTSLHNDLGAVRKAQHAAASLSPTASSGSSPTNGVPVSAPATGGKNLFMNDLAARLGAGPPGRSRASSASGGLEDVEQQSPGDLDRSPSSLTHARRPGSKKNVKATYAAAFKPQSGLNRASSNDSDPGTSSDDAGKAEESKDEEKAVAVAVPVAVPVHEVAKDSSSSVSSHAHAASFSSSSVSYVPIIQPSKGQVPPPVPRSSNSGTSSPVSSTPPSPSSAAMMAAIRRPPPVPPGGKSGPTSTNSSQPSSPSIRSKLPTPPPVPAHELAALSTVSAPVSSPSVSPIPAFQPRSLPQAPQRGGGGPSTPSKGTPNTSPNTTATNLPPPVPELPVTSSNEEYLAPAASLSTAPPAADGASVEVPAPAPVQSVGNRMGGMGGFKLPGAGAGGDPDLMAKLARKREAADGITVSPPATATATTSSSGASDSASVLSTPVTSRISVNTSPITLKPVTVSSTTSPVVSAAVPPCGKCGCTDFKQNAFQKGKCNNCFHPH